ncbi:hypothetical protein [Paracoccus pacificus]|uniref:Uncharacterized protein n=1 Tax=Paracoccus pacificus TaxID=1463598 RepID=A0ABW4R868_9RHOB
MTTISKNGNNAAAVAIGRVSIVGTKGSQGAMRTSACGVGLWHSTAKVMETSR